MSERIPALNNDGGSDLTNEYEAQIRAYCKREERAREIEQSLAFGDAGGHYVIKAGS